MFKHTRGKINNITIPLEDTKTSIEKRRGVPKIFQVCKILSCKVFFYAKYPVCQ